MPQPLILVADDYPDVRRLFSEILEHGGYDVIQAGDGAETLALAKEHNPDLILLDLNMPGCSGWDCLLSLREDSSTASICVIAISAEDHRQKTAHLQSLGFRGYLKKPVLLRDLIGAVDVCLGSTGAPDWIELAQSPLSR